MTLCLVLVKTQRNKSCHDTVTNVNASNESVTQVSPSRVASARNIAPLDMCEMLSACALLEARGAVRVAARGAGGARGRRLRLQWDEAELAATMRDKPLLAAILRDTHCLAS